jgi:hypothetical protein
VLLNRLHNVADQSVAIGGFGPRFDKPDVFDEINGVATYPAATTIEDLPLGIDGEAVVAAALRAWTDVFDADAPQFQAAALDLALHGHCARTLHPSVELSVAAHDPSECHHLRVVAKIRINAA